MTAVGPDGEPPRGTVGPTGHRSLAAFLVAGLLAGWSVRLVALRTGRAEPSVGWSVIGLLALAALILLVTAVATRRTLRTDPAGLGPDHAVNRLVLAKASALVGALLIGAYAGYAIAQLGVDRPAAQLRLWRSALAALAAAATTGAALLLERACRVPGRDA